ncbi:hypothetical protein [Staphylococcus agnetis]|uniref:Uncharacterized protein n=1 Tax=Staphylococcus agnetis TaxID=985762 RepID=A0ABX3Z389_9STAP|nr:hypothetical protein [Staphylococcus agnetis]MDG4943481.1 hypothetical protein [Staphylococcus agnetis]OSP14890.1 hypothetical protein B9L42_11645 [Staphylococcus agnetis]OSP22714.1 hypothetical protein B9M87_11335 [Staphylococcus agnetis]OTW30365.1 hypothetical protein B9M88_10460 [Staphylococcus agnetis]
MKKAFGCSYFFLALFALKLLYFFKILQLEETFNFFEEISYFYLTHCHSKEDPDLVVLRVIPNKVTLHEQKDGNGPIEIDVSKL